MQKPNLYYTRSSSLAFLTSFFCSLGLQANAVTITFNEVISGATSFGFDANADGRYDVVFSTNDPEGFNTIGPGANQTYIQEPGLEGTSLLRTDLRADFLGGATERLSFGFALNSAVESSAYSVDFRLYDDNGRLLANTSEVGRYTSTAFGTSSFPEGRVELSFAGTASYAEFNFTSEFGRFIIDDFEGDFGSTSEPAREITVFSTSYDGTIPTRGLPGIDATFGYNLSGTEISAEFVVRDNVTLEEAAATRGFDHFNFMQLVTSFPGGILVGCLSNTPFIDPQLGGCLVPNIEADNLPFYYDVGDAWIGTPFYIGDRAIYGVDRSLNELVQVGVSFADQPHSLFASESSPMSFVLFPVGVYADGTYESLVSEALFWQSTNNLFGGAVSVRSNPIDDGLEGTVLTATFGPLSGLSSGQVALLRSTGYVGDLAPIPLPPSVAMLGSAWAFLGLLGWRRRLLARSR